MQRSLVGSENVYKRQPATRAFIGDYEKTYKDRVDMVAVLGNAWIGLPLAALVVIVTVHMRNGMRDTLEDYFAGSLYRLLMLLNTLFCILVAVAGVAALLKLVFWG